MDGWMDAQDVTSPYHTINLMVSPFHVKNTKTMSTENVPNV